MASNASSTTSVTDQTANGYTALQNVTVNCHCIMNTIFIASDPKPSWFDDLNTNLAATKVLAKQWIDDLAPQLTASIPAQVINYGNTYAAVTAEILQIAAQHPNASGAKDPYIIQVLALVQALHDQVETIITAVKSTKTQLTTWGDAMQTAHDNLYKGAANIQKLHAELSADILKMDNDIEDLKAKITVQQDVIAGMGALIGVGLIAIVGGVGFAWATGGWSLIASGVGVLAVIGGAVTWGIMEGKIKDELNKISDDQQEKTSDQQQIISLKALALSASMALTAVSNATLALSDVETLWTGFKDELDSVITQLNSEGTMMVLNTAYTNAAQKAWNDATTFALNLQQQTVAVQVNPAAQQAA